MPGMLTVPRPAGFADRSGEPRRLERAHALLDDRVLDADELGEPGREGAHAATRTRAEPSTSAPEVTTPTSWRGAWRSPQRPWICSTASATVFIPCR